MQLQEQVKAFLALEIQTIGLLAEPVPQELFGEDFLITGLIDSFGFISLITAVENKFSVEITEDLQLDERIRSINGFTEVVSELLS